MSDDESSTSNPLNTYQSPIAQPMASDKLTKRVLKLVKKSGKDKLLKRGVKEVVKAVRKNVVGVAVLAGNVDPMDVMSHLPVLFEDAGIPYVYVRSKESLGSAAQSKRSVSCVLVTAAAASAEYKDSYDKVLSECKTQLSSLC